MYNETDKILQDEHPTPDQLDYMRRMKKVNCLHKGKPHTNPLTNNSKQRIATIRIATKKIRFELLQKNFDSDCYKKLTNNSIRIATKK